MDLVKFWALWLRMQSLRWMWKIARPIAVLAGPKGYDLYDRLRCPTWIPVKGERAFCHRFRGHEHRGARKPCITDRNTLGENSPRGVVYLPTAYINR
jgi:hypothetical protein